MTSLSTIGINSAKKTQIVLLIVKEIQIPNQYLKFLNIFLEKKASVLPKAIDLNQYTIKLEKSQQLPYKLIYSLNLVELEMLKIYIKINFANSFILPLKSPISALILFIKKANRSL